MIKKNVYIQIYDKFLYSPIATILYLLFGFVVPTCEAQQRYGEKWNARSFIGVGTAVCGCYQITGNLHCFAFNSITCLLFVKKLLI
jgi:hypothetical protein